MRQALGWDVLFVMGKPGVVVCFAPDQSGLRRLLAP
jgi:hypothetical protein